MHEHRHTQIPLRMVRTFAFWYPPTSCNSKVLVEVGWVNYNSLQEAGASRHTHVPPRVSKCTAESADQYLKEVHALSDDFTPDPNCVHIFASFPACHSLGMARHQRQDTATNLGLAGKDALSPSEQQSF